MVSKGQITLMASQASAKTNEIPWISILGASYHTIIFSGPFPLLCPEMAVSLALGGGPMSGWARVLKIDDVLSFWNHGRELAEAWKCVLKTTFAGTRKQSSWVAFLHRNLTIMSTRSDRREEEC